ncbi:cytochrome P450 [Novosphingobium sp. BL-8H]|uniref:cytochrome P450 n=1 Tax=Novosphingobium sp. BL-8H TaxID=3127640 RepID=UPI0037584C79
MTTQQTLETFDIHAPQARSGAECLWAKMREMQGLYRNESYGGYYVVSRYEDVLKVLTKPALFSSAHGITLPPPTSVRSLHVPAEVDPPMHGQYRALMMPFVMPEKVRMREPVVRAMVERLLAQVPDGVSFDFVRVVGRPLPILVALDLLGMPAEDAADLEQLVGQLHSDVAAGKSSGAIGRIEDYAKTILDRRRPTATDPVEDLVSSVLLGKVDGRPLTEHEQVSMIRLLLIGGFDTTSATLTEMMRWIASEPEQARRLRKDPSLIPGAIEDVVRFTSPATYLRREVTEDVELGGTQLKKGDSVLVAFGSANRDPNKFPNPDTIDPTRKPNMHVGFGAGNHRCIGSFLAKMELTTAFEEIFSQFSEFYVDRSKSVAYTSGLGQAIISLPMIFKRKS